MTVSLPFFAAPRYKRIVSTLAFLFGVAFAWHETGGDQSAWPYIACAVITGLAVLAWTWHTKAFAK